jgi:hypothetical protein
MRCRQVREVPSRKRGQVVVVDMEMGDIEITRAIEPLRHGIWRDGLKWVLCFLPAALSSNSTGRGPVPRGAYQESCVRGHSQPGDDGLGETHDHTERTD